MVDINNKLITQEGKTEPITAFEVWWYHPFKGFFEELDDAILVCKDTDFNPEEILRPTTVAVSENFWEPLIR